MWIFFDWVFGNKGHVFRLVFVIMFKMMWDILLLNRQSLLYSFVIAFIIGFILAIGSCKLNREHKKKGFKNGSLYGKTKEIDQQMYKDYRDSLSADSNSSSYLKDNIEHHANKRFY